MTDLLSIPVSDLTKEQDREIRALINLANSKEHAPVWQIFPGERLDNETFANDYPGQTVYALKEDQRIIATMTVELKADSLHVSLLAVAPIARGRVLGAQMISTAKEAARIRGLRWVQLDAVETGRLIQYYEGFGFMEVGRETKPVGFWGALIPFDFVNLRLEVS